MYQTKSQNPTNASGPSPVKDATLLSNISDRAEGNTQVIVTLTMQLNNCIDRLIGEEKLDNLDLSGHAASGICHQLEQQLIHQSKVIGNLETAIRRLTVL